MARPACTVRGGCWPSPDVSAKCGRKPGRRCPGSPPAWRNRAQAPRGLAGLQGRKRSRLGVPALRGPVDLSNVSADKPGVKYPRHIRFRGHVRRRSGRPGWAWIVAGAGDHDHAHAHAGGRVPPPDLGMRMADGVVDGQVARRGNPGHPWGDAGRRPAKTARWPRYSLESDPWPSCDRDVVTDDAQPVTVFKRRCQPGQMFRCGHVEHARNGPGNRGIRGQLDQKSSIQGLLNNLTSGQSARSWHGPRSAPGSPCRDTRSMPSRPSKRREPSGSRGWASTTSSGRSASPEAPVRRPG